MLSDFRGCTGEGCTAEHSLEKAPQDLIMSTNDLKEERGCEGLEPGTLTKNNCGRNTAMQPSTFRIRFARLRVVICSLPKQGTYSRGAFAKIGCKVDFWRSCAIKLQLREHSRELACC